MIFSNTAVRSLSSLLVFAMATTTLSGVGAEQEQSDSNALEFDSTAHIEVSDRGLVLSLGDQ